MSGKSGDKYLFESFKANLPEFDSSFSEYLNSKHGAGWDYEDCQFHAEGEMRHAYCIFERD
jgi:hypothetical protein